MIKPSAMTIERTDGGYSVAVTSAYGSGHTSFATEAMLPSAILAAWLIYCARGGECEITLPSDLPEAATKTIAGLRTNDGTEWCHYSLRITAAEKEIACANAATRNMSFMEYARRALLGVLP